MMYKTYENSVSWDYFDRYDAVIGRYMPAQGEGESFASQIATAINKLVYKWYNDGDVYDNQYALCGWWNDLSSYANWLLMNARAVELLRIRTAKTSGDYEQILKALADAFLGDEEQMELFAKRPKVDTIYKCDGPFAYVERDDEEDEYEYDEEDDEDDVSA